MRPEQGCGINPNKAAPVANVTADTRKLCSAAFPTGEGMDKKRQGEVVVDLLDDLNLAQSHFNWWNGVRFTQFRFDSDT